jgi:hypothetical protein
MPPYNFKYMTMVSGETVQQDLVFSSKSEAMVWLKEVGNIKAMAASLHEEREHTSKTNHELYAPWLEMVSAFRAKWGAEFMAEDVVFAEEDIRANLSSLS